MCAYPESVNENENSCLWCRADYQQEANERRESEKKENDNAHEKMLRRINYQLGMTVVLIVVLAAKGTVTIEDLQGLKSVVMDDLGLIATCLSNYWV